MKKRLLAAAASGIVLTLIPGVARAHCPLCTFGVGAAAVGAAWLGMSTLSIGLFVGGFSLALGLWISRMVTREFIRWQGPLLTLTSFVLTVWPLKNLLPGYTSVYLSWWGAYGTLFNRTYVLNLFIIGSIIGAVLVLVAPKLSSLLTQQRGGRRLPYQGVVLTILLVALVAVLAELIV